MAISISWVFRDLPVGPQFSVLFPNPLCLGPADPSSPSGHCRENAHTPASSVHNLSRRNSRFSSCAPHSCSQEGKCMLNGEVAAANTQLRNMVGEIHQAAGLWGGASPGVAHIYHSLLLCPFSLGGGGLPAGATLWAAFPFSI